MPKTSETRHILINRMTQAQDQEIYSELVSRLLAKSSYLFVTLAMVSVEVEGPITRHAQDCRVSQIWGAQSSARHKKARLDED